MLTGKYCSTNVIYPSGTKLQFSCFINMRYKKMQQAWLVLMLEDILVRLPDFFVVMVKM